MRSHGKRRSCDVSYRKIAPEFSGSEKFAFDKSTASPTSFEVVRVDVGERRESSASAEIRALCQRSADAISRIAAAGSDAPVTALPSTRYVAPASTAARGVTTRRWSS